MSHRNRVTKILTLISLTALAAIAAWQFYLFAAFKGTDGVVDVQGGTLHLWLAIGIALIVCIAGFLLFSARLRVDAQPELHIASQGHPLGVRSITEEVQ